MYIVILFVKTPNIEEIKQRIQDLKKLQKDDTKIWIISKDHIEIPQSYIHNRKRIFW